MKVHGSCHCGYLTFEAEIDPGKVGICHCTDCQSSTGSAFRVNVQAPGNTFRMLSGAPTRYIKTTADSGNPRVQAFCPTCGSGIYSTTPGDGQQPVYVLRVGVLKERGELAPKVQNWTRSARSWIGDIGALPANEKAAASR